VPGAEFSLLTREKHRLLVCGSQRLPTFGERLDGPVWLGLGTEPRLGVANKRTELGEKCVRGCTVPLELVDAVEPAQYESCLVHAVTVPARM
jgi:hypothetical protein